MIFSSLVFLYLFLPITLLGYYLIRTDLRNNFLLGASLVFFAWGGVSFTIILIFSIAINYVFGLLIQKNIDKKSAYWYLFAGVSVNIMLLGVFKYTNFIVQNINLPLKYFQVPELPATSIVLPVGISFYTFHSLSYLVDIYKRKTTAQKNIFNLSLYITMFSQLIAGPIIRYSDVWLQLTQRTHTREKFASGIERFLIGLGKKVLLANTFAQVADNIFATDVTIMSAPVAWLGIVCYTLQIYCDFAGYSDMAIGLGRMFGFEFLENFNFPYIARSVKEFWRRWHISLSSFFRDYVYISLGGNRVSVKRVYINLFIVFFLTGFWHGASWSFVAWGLFHGLFMVIERVGLDKLLEKIWSPLAVTYTLLVVMFAWVLFRATTLTYALQYWKAMFVFTFSEQQMDIFYNNVGTDLLLAGVIAILGSLGIYHYVGKTASSMAQASRWIKPLSIAYHVASVVFYGAILLYCTMYITSGSYNPFIYYRF